MVFWNEVFVMKKNEKPICKNCKLPFAKTDKDYDLGLVVQCSHYPEYCVKCCP